MRTTVTLDPDVHALVSRFMRERKLTFKAAVNEAIRAGLGASSAAGTSYTVARDLGEPRLDLAKALKVAAALEDEAIGRRLSEGR